MKRRTLTHPLSLYAYQPLPSLAQTGKLTRLYTQNIDGLDLQCSLPAEKVIPVHGSIGRVACEGCGKPVDFGSFCDDVKRNIKDIYGIDEAAPALSKQITCGACKRPLVKPTTVLFGSSLPEEFFSRAAEDMPSVDLLIVAGTSLVVSPANSLVYKANDKAVRLIVNNEPVGAELGIDYSSPAAGHAAGRCDVFAQGECDAVFLELMGLLGWRDDLKAMAGDLPEQSQARLERFLSEAPA